MQRDRRQPDRTRSLAAALFLLALPAAPTAAHDAWILPSSFASLAGDLVKVGIRIGHGDGEAVARNPRFLRRLVAIDEEGVETPAVGLDGSRPAGLWRPERPGHYVLVYESRPTHHELSAERFASFLAEEGLETILQQRRERGEENAPGREIYFRSLKSLVHIGEPGQESAHGPRDRELGLPLELLLEPSTGANRFQLRLLRAGMPLAGALVDVRRLALDDTPVRLRTNREGRISVPYADGIWMAAAVDMVRAGTRDDVDWESVWTSLTFRLP